MPVVQQCAVYARVSTSKAEQAKSVPDQLAECRRYAQRLGLQVVAEYRDEGISGRKGRDQRQGWDQLLRWIEAGGLPGGGVVLTWDLDRWSRDFADGLIEALQLHKRGVSIADTKDGVVSLDTLVGQVMLALKVAGAAEYVAKLSRAVKRGLESRVAQGFWMWPRPYGWLSRQVEGGHELVPHPEEAPVVRQMFGWADAGVTPIEIARRLNAAGVPSRKGRDWAAAAVRQMLRSGTHCGVIYRHETQQEVPGRIQTYVPLDQALRVRARFRSGRRPAGATPRMYPLSGLVVCAECGRAAHITGRWVHLGPQYMCPSFYCGTCPNRSRPHVRALEAAVLAWWRGLMSAGEIERLARAAVEQEYRQALAAARERAPLDAELADLDRQEGRLIELHAAGGSTELTARRLQQLQQQREAVRQRIRGLGVDVAPIPLEAALQAVRAELEAVADVRALRPYIVSLLLFPDGSLTIEAFGQIAPIALP